METLVVFEVGPVLSGVLRRTVGACSEIRIRCGVTIKIKIMIKTQTEGISVTEPNRKEACLVSGEGTECGKDRKFHFVAVAGRGNCGRGL